MNYDSVSFTLEKKYTMEQTTFTITDIDAFKKKALCWANQFQVLCALDSNQNTNDKYSQYEFVLAVDELTSVPLSAGNVFEQISKFRLQKPSWLFGYLSYDIKNEIELLSSSNSDGLHFPIAYFFEPRYLLLINAKQQLTINRNYPEATALYDLILSTEIPEILKPKGISLQSSISKSAYISKIETIKNYIIEGDVYEMNYCRELFANDVNLDPLSVYFMLNERAAAPFSSYLKIHDQYILCASPERFLQKQGTQLLSQPIKGTVKRSAVAEEDELNKSELYHSEKERAEHIMIVDLVRNDLTPLAKTGSIQVKELFGIYTFNTVHHMISSIVAQLHNPAQYIEAIKKAFPMGSMTGAPKIRAMELIETEETVKRGVFSGSIGYFTPDDNFDFNVVIRTILYNKKNQYLSIQSGGAITIDSIPEAEWDELQLKSAVIENLFI